MHWLPTQCMHGQLPPLLNGVLPDLAKEYMHGSSSWLTVLPILKHGFHLHKGDFRDVLSLQYITPSNTSSTSHAVWNLFISWSCYGMSFWGLSYNQTQWGPRSNVSLLTKVCHNVTTEPSSQPIISETIAFYLTSPNVNTTIMILHGY